MMTCSERTIKPPIMSEVVQSPPMKHNPRRTLPGRPPYESPLLWEERACDDPPYHFQPVLSGHPPQCGAGARGFLSKPVKIAYHVSNVEWLEVARESHV